jgi:hypothetical protein
MSSGSGSSDTVELDANAYDGNASILYNVVDMQDAIEFTATIQDEVNQDTTRVMGTAWPPFFNPNITGDYALDEENMERDYTDLRHVMSEVHTYPLSFKSPLNSLTDTRWTEAHPMFEFAEEPGYMGRLNAARADFVVENPNIVLSMHKNFRSLLYNKLWSITEGPCLSGRASKFRTSTDISLLTGPQVAFDGRAKEVTALLQIQIGAEGFVVSRMIRDYGTEIQELRGDATATSGELLRKIFADSQQFVAVRSGRSVFFDFFWLLLMYAYWRTKLASNAEWKAEHGVKPRDRLLAWKRQSPLLLCDTREEMRRCGAVTDSVPRPDNFLENYGEEVDTRHDPTIPFFLHASNIPPRLRCKETMEAALQYVHLLNTGTQNATEVLYAPEGYRRYIIDREFYKRLAHASNEKNHVGGPQETMRDTVEREKAVILVRTLLLWLSSKDTSICHSTTDFSAMVCGANEEPVFRAFAAIECVEYLYSGFLQCSTLAASELSLKHLGFLAGTEANPRLVGDEYCISSLSAELLAPIPAGTLRPSSKEEELETNWQPAEAARREQRARAANPRQSELFHQTNAIMAEQAARIEKKSMPLADEKNDSVEWVQSQYVSFIEDYELLPLMLQASDREGGLAARRIDLNKMRYAARLDGVRLRILKNIPGPRFQALTFEGADAENEGVDPLLAREIGRLRHEEALRQRAAARRLVRTAMRHKPANIETANKRASAVARDLAQVHELLRTMAAIKSSKTNTAKLRKEIDSRYFAPKKMTTKAMCKLLSGMIEPKKGDIKYGLPHYSIVEQHIKPSGLNPTEFARAAATGCRKKTLKEAIDILGGIVGSDDIGDPAAMAAIDNLEEDQSYESDGQYEPDAAAVTLASRARQGSGISVMPLLYSARYTYEVVFYLAQLDQKIVYPMGKSYPDLGWIYTALELLDPNNRLVLRYDADKLLVSIGGLRMLDAYTKVVRSASPSIAAMVAKAASIGTSDANSRYLTTAVQTATTLGILYRQASQIKGELARHKADFAEELEKFNRMKAACEPDPLLRHRFNEQHAIHVETIKALNSNLTKEKIEELIIARFGLVRYQVDLREDCLYYCEMGFANFTSSIVRACAELDKIDKPRPHARIFWLLDTAVQANSTVKHERDTIRGKQIHWFRTLENFLTVPALQNARSKLIGPAATVDALLATIRKAKLYAVEHADRIDLYRPAEAHAAEQDIDVLLDAPETGGSIREELLKLSESELRTAANTESAERAKLLG